MADEVIVIDRSEGIAVVTLNRPQALNALNRTLRCAIADTFCTLKADTNVGVAILTGAGRAFCAGVDLKELSTAAVNPLDDLISSCRALARDMLSCDHTVVSEIKRLIDTGYAGTLRDGLRVEDEAARAHIERMSRADVAKRRADVQARGRAQSGLAPGSKE